MLFLLALYIKDRDLRWWDRMMWCILAADLKKGRSKAAELMRGSSHGGFGDYMFCFTIYGCFLKWWYPTIMGFPTKNDDFGVFWGYHHLRKHPYDDITWFGDIIYDLGPQNQTFSAKFTQIPIVHFFVLERARHTRDASLFGSLRFSMPSKVRCLGCLPLVFFPRSAKKSGSKFPNVQWF